MVGASCSPRPMPWPVSSRRTLKPRASAIRSTAAPTSRTRAPAVAVAIPRASAAPAPPAATRAPRRRGRDPARQRRPRGGDQPLVGGADGLDCDRGRRVAEGAGGPAPDIDLYQVPRADPPRSWDPVDGLVAHADADRAREAVGDDRTRPPSLGGDDLGGERIELAGGHAR